MDKKSTWGLGIFLAAITAALIFVGGVKLYTDDPVIFEPTAISNPMEEKRLIALEQMNLFGIALRDFKTDINRFPSNEENLKALLSKPSGLDSWNGPYLPSDKIPMDPWGNLYVYRLIDKDKYQIVCFGADGKKGGIDEDKDLVFEQ